MFIWIRELRDAFKKSFFFPLVGDFYSTRDLLGKGLGLRLGPGLDNFLLSLLSIHCFCLSLFIFALVNWGIFDNLIKMLFKGWSHVSEVMIDEKIYWSVSSNHKTSVFKCTWTWLKGMHHMSDKSCNAKMKGIRFIYLQKNIAPQSIF